MDELIKKAAILQEALPYLRRFHGRTFVVKYGGHAMLDQELRESFAKDVALLRYIGIQVVVVHGGGPQIDATLERLGIASTFAAGLRVTTEETMQVVEMVLSGSVNSEIVGNICTYGGKAIGLSGRDASFLRARRLGELDEGDSSGHATTVDLGRVGQIVAVDPTLISNLSASGFVPVIAPIAVDAAGKTLNVNADTAAGSIAVALSAAKLILMTDVEGVKSASGALLRSLGRSQAAALIADAVIVGGMIPKVECALDAVARGVEKVHIIDGRRRHALLLEIFTDQGVGTEIGRDDAATA